MRIYANLVCALLSVLTISLPSFGQADGVINLWPENAKYRKSTKSLVSSERRVGDTLYQVFSFRNGLKREAFRVEIGFWNDGMLQTSSAHGVIVERDMNGDERPDFVWESDDFEYQRLFWYLSQGSKYLRINLLKTVGQAWQKKFGGETPDFGEIGPEYRVDEMLWDWKAKILTVMVGPNDEGHSKADDFIFKISPSEFVYDTRY